MSGPPCPPCPHRAWKWVGLASARRSSRSEEPIRACLSPRTYTATTSLSVPRPIRLRAPTRPLPPLFFPPPSPAPPHPPAHSRIPARQPAHAPTLRPAYQPL